MTDTDLNQEIRDPLNFLLNRPHCFAYKVSDQSWGTGSFAAVALNGELYDWSVSPLHDTVTNNTRITAVEAGIYSVKAKIRFAAAGNPSRIMVRKNAAGSDVAGTEIFQNYAPSNNYADGTADVPMNANDYLELFARQESGGAQNLLGGAAITFMSVLWESKI